ncbi:TetR family transcriptional regulator [Nonomuraea dietziae]|uniref:TetR family transcriptional regulator n=1 Tax=Nonomuraea dietziae TaxID=65515 RepID=UPI00342F48CE
MRDEEATPQRILAAARALFATRGYRATSMNAIAEQVGITKAALCYHFSAKDDLLHRLTEPLLQELEGALAQAKTHDDPERVRWSAIEGFDDRGGGLPSGGGRPRGGRRPYGIAGRGDAGQEPGQGGRATARAERRAVATVRRLYGEGHAVDEIAERFNVSRATVYRVFKSQF